MKGLNLLLAIVVFALGAFAVYSCAGTPASEESDDDDDTAGDTKDDDDNDDSADDDDMEGDDDDTGDDDDNDADDDEADDDDAEGDDDDNDDDDVVEELPPACADWKAAICECFKEEDNRCKSFEDIFIKTYKGEDLEGYCAEELSGFKCDTGGNGGNGELGECPAGLRCAEIQGNLVCVDDRGFPGNTEQCDANKQCPAGKTPVELAGYCTCIVPCKTEEPNCIDGKKSRKLGEECKCGDDCLPEYSFCGTSEIMGAKYCTTAECKSDDECEVGYGCFDVPSQAEGTVGAGSFCRKCKTANRHSVPEGGDCSCDVDCGEGYGCIESKCTLLCDENAQCPAGYECREGNMLDNRVRCVKCAASSDNDKVAYEGACACNTDCQPYKDSDGGEHPVACYEETCVIPECAVSPADNCPKGLVCKESILGKNYCTSKCDPNPGSKKIGDACACHSDCEEAAPTCIDENVPIIGKLNFCTLQNCTVGDPQACPDPTNFICCNFYGQYTPSCVSRSLSWTQYACQ